MDRTLNDFKRWNSNLINKIYYQNDPKDNKRFRTIRMHFNPFANKITPQYSNWIEGVPPEEMEPVNPRLLSSLATMQHNPMW